MNQEEKKEEEKIFKEEKLPENHFTQVDIDKAWGKFLNELKEKDIVRFSAVNNCVLTKVEENLIKINLPSESVKKEFETIRKEFFNHFKHKVNNFKIEIIYEFDENLKKEILTKRKIFDKFAEQNPILRDLDNLLKFDFS